MRNREAPGPVPLVEDRVDLDDVHRAHALRLRDLLHGVVRLAVGEPALHGGADARGEVGVHAVEVEGDVERPRVGAAGHADGQANPVRDEVAQDGVHGAEPVELVED